MNKTTIDDGWPADYQERFWRAYPRRIAKKAAMKALDKVRRSGEVDWDRLISAVDVFARHVSGKEPQYVCHPTTWLNQGRWDDEHTDAPLRPAPVGGSASRGRVSFGDVRRAARDRLRGMDDGETQH